MDLDIPDDLAPREKTFTGPGGKTYTLREPSEAAAIAFRAHQLRGARVVDGKVNADIERVQEGQSLLVSMCVFDEAGKPLGAAAVRAWPARLVKTLFTLAVEWGDLNEQTETEEALQKQAESIQEKLTRLREARENGRPQSASATTGL